MTAEQPPGLNTLVRALPVGTSQVHAGWTLTLIAVELWDNGFVANFRLHRAGCKGELNPTLALAARDDCGCRYRARLGASSGGGDADSYQWHLSYIFAPALDPAARELRVDAALHLMDDEAPPRPAVEARTEPGPWSFTVGLPGEA